MAIKYKIKLRDLKLEYLKEYIAPIFNFLKPKKKITNISELKDFIQRKSAWVSQETLYGYLKTRMGAKYILMFEDEIFLGSINKAKWNIYAVALQDLTFYCLSYLKNNLNFDQTSKAKDIYEEILNDEKKNQMPILLREIMEKWNLTNTINIWSNKKQFHLCILSIQSTVDNIDKLFEEWEPQPRFTVEKVDDSTKLDNYIPQPISLKPEFIKEIQSI